MPCYRPLFARKTPEGEVTIGRQAADAYQLRLPCGGCIGCRKSRAQAWALRCQLELQDHRAAVFTTLTYSDENLPPTLDRAAVRLWLRRLRRQAARPLRFFASGEYGEQNQRPHYHAILYGLAETDAQLIDQSWARGFTKTVNLTPAAIAYVAGYNSKKIGWKKYALEERVDPSTGEVYHWQPPFQEMSRRPGIGAHARKFTNSWRTYAVLNGHEIPVPRYLHDAWKQQATPEQLEELELEKIKRAILRDTSEPRLLAAEAIAQAQQAESARKRKL